MKLYEEINCDLCGSKNYESIYDTKQYSSSLGELEIKLVICKNCSFVYQNPQLTSQSLDLHYAKASSGDIFRFDSQDSRASILLKERQKFIYKSIDLFKIENICDVGGGTGRLLSSLKFKNNVKKTLIEPSNAIDKNKDKDIIRIKSKVENIKLEEEEKFDLLMCISALEHFKNPTKVLKSFSSLISEDGYILIEIPNSLKPYNTFAEYYSYEHVNHFTYETILFLLEKSNFYPIKIEESESVSTIRILAKKKNLIYETSFNHFKKFKKEKEDFISLIKKSISESFSNNCVKNFSIYGAGDHTRFLLERLDILNNVDYIIDSDPKKWNTNFCGKEIISPKMIEENGIKDILISSHDFEKEIYFSLKNKELIINIMTIYKEY